MAAAAAIAGVLFGLGGTASATTIAATTTAAVATPVTTTPAGTAVAPHAPSSEQTAQALVKHDIANHRVTSPQATRATSVSPDLTCAWLYVCGEGANGNSFAYTTCDVTYELPDLVGNGPLINNQTSGAVAYFYDENGNFLFSSTAYDSRTVNWTPVWYAIACLD